MTNMRNTIGHVMNPEIVDHKFALLVNYIMYILREQNNKKLE